MSYASCSKQARDAYSAGVQVYFSNMELQQIVTNSNSQIAISFLKRIPKPATFGKLPANNTPCLTDTHFLASAL